MIPKNPKQTDPAKHLASFASFVATCEKHNTDEWMRMLADWINGIFTAEGTMTTARNSRFGTSWRRNRNDVRRRLP